jgi:hypothetical protein
MSARRKLFITVAKGSVLFTIGCWAVVLALAFLGRSVFDGQASTLVATIGVALVVVLPDALAAWWIFRKLLTDRPRNDARRGAIGFAVSAPLVLGIGNVPGTLIGGWAERLLGSRFIFPTVVAFVVTLMVFVPSGIVTWLLHPSGGVDAIVEGNRQ